ncbi:MAG TPA: c-type cytochrome [Burkholderiales bacterium]|nr:c-type cytochrome [Burkholderiales bacterium]
MNNRAGIVAMSCACLLLVSCEREARRFQQPAPTAATPQAVPGSDIRAGAQPLTKATPNPAEQNAYAVAQGKRLFVWYNCVGCHAHGGGGSGPALMDDKWLYGAEPVNVYRTIVEGRPNGMPAFGTVIPESQVWQLVAYVRSMSGLLRPDVAPGRDDDLAAVPPESRREPAVPKTAK